MPYERPFSSPLAVLSASVRVGRPFGIEVRVYATALFVVLFGTIELSRVFGLGTALAVSTVSALLLYFVVLTHELGHAFAGRAYGVQTPTITLSAFGGLAHQSSGAPSPAAEWRIALAGPLTHLPWIGLGYAVAEVAPSVRIGDAYVPLAAYFWRMNVALLVFNLLPAFPMDGGRALRAILAGRMHPNRATLIACRIGIFVAIGLAAWGIRLGGFYGSVLVIIAVTNTLTCLREMTAARHVEGPYEIVDPWSTDGDDWKRGAPDGRRAEVAGVVVGARERRPSRASPRVVEAGPPPPPGRTPADDAELDALLDRVSAVGVAGLSSAERDRLRRLSETPRSS